MLKEHWANQHGLCCSGKASTSRCIWKKASWEWYYGHFQYPPSRNRHSTCKVGGGSQYGKPVNFGNGRRCQALANLLASEELSNATRQLCTSLVVVFLFSVKAAILCCDSPVKRAMGLYISASCQGVPRFSPSHCINWIMCHVDILGIWRASRDIWTG